MGKYRPMQLYFEKCRGHSVTLTYEQFEQILGDKLPMSAYKYPAWWGNGGHEHADSWLGSGWKVEEVRFGEFVKFTKGENYFSGLGVFENHKDISER